MLGFSFLSLSIWSNPPDLVPGTMTRSNSERIEKIEAKKAEMKEHLASANTQLTEITATLAELSRTHGRS